LLFYSVAIAFCLYPFVEIREHSDAVFLNPQKNQGGLPCGVTEARIKMVERSSLVCAQGAAE